jgi:hypothetical protein
MAGQRIVFESSRFDPTTGWTKAEHVEFGADIALEIDVTMGEIRADGRVIAQFLPSVTLRLKNPGR